MFALHDAHTVVKLGGYELGRREKLFTLIPGTIIIVALTGAERCRRGAMGHQPCSAQGSLRARAHGSRATQPA